MKRFIVFLALLAAVIALALPITAQAQGGPTIHTVAAGENLYRISLKYGVTIAAIQQANPRITNANLIYVGQQITIPTGGTTPPSQPPTQPPSQPPTQPPPSTPGGTYIVVRGDTLYKIARQFNTTVQAIASANNIVNINLIFVGQKLTIAGAPGGNPNPNPNPTPPPGNNPPPLGNGSFELGGQVLSLGDNTQAVMRSAKMAWVKFQIQVGDPQAAGLIQLGKNNGFKVLISLKGEKDRVLDGAYQDQYATYAGDLARAGADGIEVWNEPNIDREWPTGQINPANYVILLTKAYNAAKQANNNILIITAAPSPTGAEGAFGLARVWNDDRYYSGLAQAGAANVSDCIGVHYNEGVLSPTQSSGDPRGDNYPTRYFVPMLNRALAAFPTKQACFTELGYLSPEGYGPLPSDFSWAARTTAQQQAQWLGEAVAIARQNGRVRLLIIFNIDFTRYDADPQAGYAIIRPGNVCIACATLSAAMP